jgi:hypothetical protein
VCGAVCVLGGGGTGIAEGSLVCVKQGIINDAASCTDHKQHLDVPVPLQQRPLSV